MGRPQRKYTKKEANYRMAKFTSKNKCGNCIYFMKTKHLCHIVLGIINTEGICKFHKNNKR